MSPGDTDTIVACATPWGRGAVAVVRLTGSGARRIVGRLCPGGGRWVPRRASVRTARDGSGAVLDRLLVTWMPGPHSYTGEDVIELGCHGNPVVVEAVVDACVSLGARLARPGEFTRRALESGRLDLVEAESVDALIRAQSLSGARLAAGAAERIGDVVADLRERLLDLAAELEARLDHPGEELGEDSDTAVADALQAVARDGVALARTWRAGRIRLEGARVGLVGPVNAGKSSLFNRLVGQERALVSAEPGTTRDVVERGVIVDGLAITFLDSAGERARATELERAGQALAADLLADADLVLLVLPGHRPCTALDRRLRAKLAGRPHLVVTTHADLPAVAGSCGADPDLDALAVSSRTGVGIDVLRRAIRDALIDQPAQAPAAVLVSHRQHGLVQGVAACAEEARIALLGPLGPAIAAEAVTRALELLSELSGEDVREAVLDRLFARFCVGK